MTGTETDIDLIGVVEKNRSEDVRVAISTWGGTPMIDLRVFASFSGAPERAATKKGVGLRIERLPDLIELLNRALEKARVRGLIT